MLVSWRGEAGQGHWSHRPPLPTQTPDPVSGSACPVGALLGLGSTWLPFPLPLLVICPLPMSTAPLSCVHWNPCLRTCVEGLPYRFEPDSDCRSSATLREYVLLLRAWFPVVPVTTGQKLTDKLQVCPSYEWRTLGLP